MNAPIRITWALLLLGSSCHLVPAAAATDGRYAPFRDGSVLLYCTTPDAVAHAPDSAFEAVFPKLIENLQVRANEGKVVRAHFLSDAAAGIFVVVGGKDRDEALRNALELQAQNTRIIRDAIAAADATDIAPPPQYCPMIEIGPVAVLPMR